jgi:phosphoribosylformimino-5-aminoimidazole carboxamide ribotide isomerase
MIVYPAIDIRGGRCVRLVEGDFSRETVFDADPAHAAWRWQEEGAEWLHVVDLDGAKAGHPVNEAAIAAIRERVTLKMQLGGGIRTREDVERALARGIERVVLGSAAVNDPPLMRALLADYGESLAVALDARDGMLATDAWLAQSAVSAVELARELAGHGLRHALFTDIRRDGTLTGPNLDILAELVATPGLEVIASGGIGTLEDIRNVQGAGAAGVIVGRALYDGRVRLADALRLAQAGLPA